MDEQEEYGDYDSNSTVLGTYGSTDQQGMKWQLDPKDVLDEIEMQLKGQEIKDGKLETVSTPLMNKEGIAAVKVILRGHLHTSIALTEIEKEEAYSLTHGAADLMNDQLYINGEKWDVQDANKTIINNLVEDAIFLFLMRPVKGKERDRWTKTYSLSENQAQNAGRVSGLFNTGGNNGYN